MAFQFSMVGRSGEPVAQRAIAALAAEIVRLDPAVVCTPSDDGVGWAAIEVVSSRTPEADDFWEPDPQPGFIGVEVHTRANTVTIVVTLSGGTTDRQAVEAVQTAAANLWQAVEEDDED